MSFAEVGGRRLAGLIAAALIALSCALALPAAASASAEFEVNDTGDEADLPAAGCLTAGGKCTLRAAIEAANASANTGGELDRISFEASVFDGGATSTITLATSLPPIAEPVRVNGGECLHGAEEIHGPCVGVNGPGASNPALTVANADGVEILGLAVTGASVGINIIESEEVRVNGNWLGVKLDGGAGGNTTGIFVDPKSNRDRIGGEGPGSGNVFANNSADGLAILGADETLVLGNYFGVEPDGLTPAGNGENIEVASQLAGGFEAEKNLIGVQGPFSDPSTPACDIGCNVIAGATASGVDLQGNSVQGESPAVETHVAGNFIGLAADGTTVVPNAVSGLEGAAGVKVGAAEKTLIGGPDKGKNEVNFFAGGAVGIYMEDADGFQVVGNEIGFSPAAAPVTSPGVGMFVYCACDGSATEEAKIEDNAIGMDAGGVGIEQVFLGATIAGNFIQGGQTGILSRGTGSPGNLIEGNLIEGAEGNGILLRSDGNQVLGNEVAESGAAGISVQDTGAPFASPTTENQIGGDSEAEENGIFDSGDDAIEIVDFEETANEVARNFGSGNGGLFIDLVATEPGKEPNGGIKPPPFSTSTQSTASGSGAKAGAVIRVFSKGSAEPGELEFFLAETTADAGGNWKVAYPAQIPTGTIVAATQTSKGATSELSTATSTADPVKPKGPAQPGCPAAGPAKCSITPPPGSPPTPQTKISKGPKAKSKSTTATFKFSSSVKGSTFQCKLDKGKFKQCKSPKKYKKLKPGKHVFKVRAVNSAGVADPTPAKRAFTVLD